MSINVELRMKDATDFSSQLIYPRAHWQHLDGIPASFNPASHTHDIGSVVNLSTTLANMQSDIDVKIDKRSGTLKSGGIVDTTGLFPYAITTAQTVIGFEYNVLLNAQKKGYTVTQSGSGQISNPYGLFDGLLGPNYSGDGVDPSNPFVLLVEGLPNVHTQTGAVFGWTSRYWNPTKYKVEAYDSYQDRGWKTLVDEQSGITTKDLVIPIYQSGFAGSLTKFRITIYDSNGSTGSNGFRRWGLSEVFFIHPEAQSTHQFLSVEWAKKLHTPRTINGVSFDGSSNISISAPASDVYSWAKASTKPSYTPSEVGAAPEVHTHPYDNYDHWGLSVGGQAGGASREQQSGMLLTLTAGNNIDLYYDDVGNQVYVSFYHEGEVDIESGDHLMIADNSDSNKLKRSDITFGTDDGTFLARDGNFKSALKKTTLLSTAFSFSTTSVAKTMPSSITGKTIYVSWSLNSDYNECYVSAFQFHSHDNTPVYGFATYYSGYPIQGYNWRLVSTSSTNLSFSTGRSWYITPSGSYTSMGSSTQTIYIKEIYTYD